MDSRAYGLKDFGAQPLFAEHLRARREIDEIMLNQTKGKEQESSLPRYKKNFTPITTYMKSLKDSHVTKTYGKFMVMRDNLNVS